MIERLLAADAALERGDLDLADRLFGQVVEADSRNAIAVVGLGRVAARRGDLDDARALMARALEIDPDEAAAQRFLAETAEGAAPAPEPAPPARTHAEVEWPSPVPDAPPAAAPSPGPAPARRPSLLDRIRAWLGRSRRWP